MTAKSQLRGHMIEYNDKEWVYSDTKEPTVDTWTERPCGYCGRYATKEGHDACLGTLPDVMNACCGHGDIRESYIQYSNGITVRGNNAIKVMEEITRDEFIEKLIGGDSEWLK